MNFAKTDRKAEHAVEQLLIERWSPRAMSGELISHEELMSLFEAARWAPSSFNNQPWRFIYALKDADFWPIFFNLLTPSNQEWAVNGACLIVALSHKYFEHNNKPSRTHSLDTGAATENMALQGHSMGLVVHGMEGFDYERARKELGVPIDFDIEAMYVVGRPGNISELPAHLQAREKPSGRKKISQIAFEGQFLYR
jgi:nitroreductase